MKRHSRSRLRRWLFWPLAAITLLCLALWVFSFFYELRRSCTLRALAPGTQVVVTGPTATVSTLIYAWSTSPLYGGRLQFLWLDLPQQVMTVDELEIQWSIEPRTTPMFWWFDIDFSGRLGAKTAICIPTWFPLVVFLGATVLCWPKRAIPEGHCSACRYDCRALPPRSPCPECGRPAA